MVKYNFVSIASKLQLKDEIKAIQHEGPFGTACVIKVDDDFVTISRPYGITSDYAGSSGVIFYTGIETYHLTRNNTEYWVYRREEAK